MQQAALAGNITRWHISHGVGLRESVLPGMMKASPERGPAQQGSLCHDALQLIAATSHDAHAICRMHRSHRNLVEYLVSIRRAFGREGSQSRSWFPGTVMKGML